MFHVEHEDISNGLVAIRRQRDLLQTKGNLLYENEKAAPLAIFLLLLASTTANALPRDAVATLNRCGKPLKGDEIVLDNSVAGGHRTLKYERGILHFDKTGMDGWTFVSGDHKRQQNLTADEMAKFMPCLKDALADSALPEPIKPMTSVQRVEVSAKRDYKMVVFGTLAFLIVLGIAFFLWSKRDRDAAVEEE